MLFLSVKLFHILRVNADKGETVNFLFWNKDKISLFVSNRNQSMFQESPRWKHSGMRLELTWGLQCGAGGSWGSMQGPQDANRYTWSVQSFFRRCKTQKTKGHWNHRKKFEYLKKEKTFLYMEALEQQLLSLEYW